MFSRKSRYKNLDVAIAKNRDGHNVEIVSLRLLPEVEGTFHHILEQGQRLDHLAYKYYRQPQKWWHICDANPYFLSPLALVGKGPLVTALFTVTYNNAGSPPWYALIKAFSREIGVKWVFLQEEDPDAAPPVNNKKVMTLIYNRFNLDDDDIVKKIREVPGFDGQLLQTVTRVGKQIVIPPDTIE